MGVLEAINSGLIWNDHEHGDIMYIYIYIYHIHIHIYIIHSSSHSQYPIAQKHYGHVAIMNWGQYRLSQISIGGLP